MIAGEKQNRRASRHTYLVPQIISQRRRPDRDRDDLAKPPRRIVNVVGAEPIQVLAKEVEGIHIQPEEDEMEQRGADAQDGAGVAEEQFRRWGSDAEGVEDAAIDASLVGIVGAAEVVSDYESEGDEGEDEDAVCAAAAAAGVEAEVVAVFAGGVAPRDEVLGGAGWGSVLRC